MTKIRSTKHALLMSALSLFICISMLVGSTYAWFTDSVTSGKNVILTGTLDVVLEYKTNWSDAWAPVDGNTKIFNDGALYEPGYTEVVFLRVSNAGSLALKYMLSFNIANEESAINVYGDEFKLSDYLQVGTYIQNENVTDSDMISMFGDRKSALNSVELNTIASADAKICDNEPILPGEDTAKVVAVVLTMPENVGNEANTKFGEELPYIELGVRLYATQYTHEKDSFDDQYDANVDQPNVHEIHNAADFTKAFAEGGQAIIENMDLSGENAVYAELAADKSLALNTNNSTIAKQDDKEYVIINYGDLEITGNGTITTEFKGSIENWGKLYVNNLNIDVKGNKYGFHVKDGECEINNITLTAQRGGLNVQGGKVTVNSGSVTSTTPDSSFGIGAVVYVGGTSEVIINGGDYRYEGKYMRHAVLYAGNDSSIEVYGGTFGKGGSATNKKPWLQTAQNGTITLYGGSFEFDPTQYLSESITLGDGYEVVKGENGWWNVTEIVR